MNYHTLISELIQKHGRTIKVVEKQRLLFLNLTKTIGWLWVDDRGSHWVVFLANGESTHNRGDGPCYAIDFLKTSGVRFKRPGLTGSWKSHLTLHPIRDEREAQDIFEYVGARIEMAYNHLQSSSAAIKLE